MATAHLATVTTRWTNTKMSTKLVPDADVDNVAQADKRCNFHGVFSSTFTTRNTVAQQLIIVIIGPIARQVRRFYRLAT
jgi:hypothetical protein